MLSFELIQAIIELRTKLKLDGNLGQILARLSPHHTALMTRLGGLLQQGSAEKAWAESQNVFGDINRIAQLTREIKHKTLFSELTTLEDAVNKFSRVTGSEKLEIGLLPVIEKFSSDYENIVSTYSREHTLDFIIASQILYQVLLSTAATLDTIIESLENDKQYAGEKQEEFSILLHPEMEVSKVAVKLNALAQIYSEACELLNVSHSEYPLYIAKMESGSLWLKLFGHNRVVTFILYLVERGVGFFHRNYTREGKIEAIPKKIEVINDVLGLKNRLAAEGIDTAAMEENISKSGIKISEELNRLLGGEAVVKVNRVTYSIGQEVEKQYIEASRQLLLSPPTEDENKPAGEIDSEIESH